MTPSNVEDYLGIFAERELDDSIIECLSLFIDGNNRTIVNSKLSILINSLIQTEGCLNLTPKKLSGDAEKLKIKRTRNIYRNTIHLTSAFLFTIHVPFRNQLDILVRTFDSSGIVLYSNKNSKVDLKKAYLRGAQLKRANLSCADMSGAILRESCLVEAVLGETILDGAELRGAHMRDAKLIGASLVGADLSKVDLSHAVLNGAHLNRAHLYRADLMKASLVDAVLSHVDLNKSDLSGSNLKGADLSHSYLNYADLRNADLTGTDLTGADLRGANLQGSILNVKSLKGAKINYHNIKIISPMIPGYHSIQWADN